MFSTPDLVMDNSAMVNKSNHFMTSSPVCSSTHQLIPANPTLNINSSMDNMTTSFSCSMEPLNLQLPTAVPGPVVAVVEKQEKNEKYLEQVI